MPIHETIAKSDDHSGQALVPKAYADHANQASEQIQKEIHREVRQEVGKTAVPDFAAIFSKTPDAAEPLLPPLAIGDQDSKCQAKESALWIGFGIGGAIGSIAGLAALKNSTGYFAGGLAGSEAGLIVAYQLSKSACNQSVAAGTKSATLK